jgi:8-oxo-dGTP diphosphatase
MMAASAIIIEQGKVLLVRDIQGFWSGVGGFVESGEAPEQAIVREIQEELGVDSTVARHFRPIVVWNVAHVEEQPVSFLLFPHAMELKSMDLMPDPREVTGVAWVAPSQLGEYEMLPYIKSMFDDRAAEWFGA